LRPQTPSNYTATQCALLLITGSGRQIETILARSTWHRQDDNSNSGPWLEWVDLAKGVAIFLVVFGHNSSGLVESGVLRNSPWSTFTDRYIYVFHVPLFFFLAGLFVARSAHRTFHDYFLNKISVIAYPYFLWSLLEGSIQIFASRYTNNHLTILDLIQIIYKPIGQYWFLYVIFLMYMIYWWINHATISVSNFLVFAILLYAIEAFGINIMGSDVLRSFCSFLIYFALGAKVAETSFFTDLNLSKGMFLSSLAIGGYVLIAVAVAINVSQLPFLHAALATTGTISTIALAMLLYRSPVWWPLRIMGVYSLEIYVGHTIFASGARIALQKAFSYSGPLMHLVLGTALGISIPLLLAIWGPKVGLPYLFTWSRSRRNAEISAVKLPDA
jgi:fucose 4-O-acetylase-like acetyltransferase